MTEIGDKLKKIKTGSSRASRPSIRRSEIVLQLNYIIALASRYPLAKTKIETNRTVFTISVLSFEKAIDVHGQLCLNVRLTFHKQKMEIYANPPLLTVSFKRNGRQSIPNSPLGSPPNTPKRNSPVADVLNTSTTTLNTFNSSAGAVVHQKVNIEMPMDEKECYEGGKMSTIKTTAGEEVPDDEVPSLAKHSNQNLNQTASSKGESMVANFMTPERDLLSPPKVLKKMTTVLHVESDNFYENEGLIPLSPSPRNINNDKKSTLNMPKSTSSSSNNIKNKTHEEFDKIADLDNQETGGAFPDDEGYIPPTTPSGEIMSSSKSLDSDVPDDETTLDIPD